MTRVLVTGADGFIGSHLVDALVSEGHDVRASVMYNAMGSRGCLEDCDPGVLREVDVVATDIRDRDAVSQLVAGCEVVFNLAALIGIPYSYQAPQSYIDTNVTGTLNLLAAARELGVEHFIQTSTSEVYGSAQFTPMSESHPLRAQSPYAASKIASDQMALAFHRTYGISVTVIRPFNTYGPRQSARAIIPTVIRQLLRSRGQVELGALSPVRDLTFVSDTAMGFVKAMRTSGATGHVLNLGTGFGISIGDLAELIADEMGMVISVAHDHNRMRPEASEVDRLISDASLARELIDWEPRLRGVEGLREGLRTTIAWFESRATDLLRGQEYLR